MESVYEMTMLLEEDDIYSLEWNLTSEKEIYLLAAGAKKLIYMIDIISGMLTKVIKGHG
ncbi:MAG: hypothetical protein MHPSP_000757, partial [Paramarteilia canceri]